MPSLRIVPVKPKIEHAIAKMVSDHVMPVRSRTNVLSEDESNTHSTIPVLMIITPAHSSDIRTKNCCTRGRRSSSGSSGQKSCAKRWVNGRWMIAEPIRTKATSMLQAIGCKKYRSTLGDERHHGAQR